MKHAQIHARSFPTAIEHRMGENSTTQITQNENVILVGEKEEKKTLVCVICLSMAQSSKYQSAEIISYVHYQVDFPPRSSETETLILTFSYAYRICWKNRKM